MGSFSIFHWLVVLVVVLVLFGAGRIPTVMGDLAKGIKAFRAGLRDEEKPLDGAAPQPQPQLDARSTVVPPPVATPQQTTPPHA
jgi:sec-independent protein translocase protein TatA